MGLEEGVGKRDREWYIDQSGEAGFVCQVGGKS